MDSKLLWSAIGALLLLIAGIVSNLAWDVHLRLRDNELEDVRQNQALRRLEACHLPGLDGVPNYSCHKPPRYPQ